MVRLVFCTACVLNFIFIFFIQIDEDRHRVSLGLKESYFDSDLTDDENGNENDGGRVPMDISRAPQMSGGFNSTLVLPGPEPRASVPPLQVALDEYEGSDQEGDQKAHEIANGSESNVKKNDRRLKEKARKQRFSHISFLYLQQWHRRLLHHFFPQGNRNQCLGGKGFTERYTTDSR